MRIDVTNLVEKIAASVKKHELEPGIYSRWIDRPDTGVPDKDPNPYGSADAVNILYTINEFPRDLDERAALIKGIQSFQNEKTGMFTEPTHITTHTTAHCTAALELLDARPLYPFYDIESFTNFEEFKKGLEEQGFNGHYAPAIYSSFVITNAVDSKWRDKYFDFLDESCNPETGFWCFNPETPVYLAMASAFHFYFTYTHAKRPFPYPEKLIDACLDMYLNGKMHDKFGKWCHFTEMDWVFCLNRSLRQTNHRYDEVKAAILKFAIEYIDALNKIDWEKDDHLGARDLHLLFGTVCCLAELQQALPGVIHSETPLRQVLDRRPFI